MSWLLILTLLCEVSMASGNNGRRNDMVNPKSLFGRQIDPGGVSPKPINYGPIDPDGISPKPIIQPVDPGGINPKPFLGGTPIDPGGVNPKPVNQPIDPGGVNPKRPWWMAYRGEMY